MKEGFFYVEEEQNGKAEATYGEYLLQNLSDELTAEFGRAIPEGILSSSVSSILHTALRNHRFRKV